MASGMLAAEMIEDTAKIVNDGIIRIKSGSKQSSTTPPASIPSLIAQKIADRLHSEKQ